MGLCCSRNARDDDVTLAKLRAATNKTPTFTLVGLTLPAKVIGLYDGDSPTVVLPFKGDVCAFKTRIAGIDTLEMKTPKDVPESKRDAYKKTAVRAKNEVLRLVTGAAVQEDRDYSRQELNEILLASQKLVEVKINGYDKYGRLLIDMRVDGKSVAEHLLDKKLAYAYDGGAKEKDALV